jgi:CheY-like chemotaxis protein
MVGGRVIQHVLVVEDEFIVRLVLRYYLERMGLAVTEVKSGCAALQLLEEHPGSVDALLVDLGLPDMSGEELARRAKGDTPLVFMSGRTELLAELPAPVLIKPFDQQTLRSVLDPVLGSSRAVPR